jgi:hypothetical protein
MVTRLAPIVMLVALAACQGTAAQRRLVFPEGMFRAKPAPPRDSVPAVQPLAAAANDPRSPRSTAPGSSPAAAHGAGADAAAPTVSAAPLPPPAPRRTEPAPMPYGRYVLRLAQQGQVWELELPEQAGGYEIRIPLAGGGPAEMLTPADEELLVDAARDAKSGGATDGLEVPSSSPTRPLDPRRAAARRSYLGGLAKVTEMYQARRYELALVEVVNLEAAYPEDARILAMKGSLLLKLGKKRLAREAWLEALAINPSDAGVAEALRELGDSVD